MLKKNVLHQVKTALNIDIIIIKKKNKNYYFIYPKVGKFTHFTYTLTPSMTLSNGKLFFNVNIKINKKKSRLLFIPEMKNRYKAGVLPFIVSLFFSNLNSQDTGGVNWSSEELSTCLKNAT